MTILPLFSPRNLGILGGILAIIVFIMVLIPDKPGCDSDNINKHACERKIATAVMMPIAAIFLYYGVANSFVHG